MASDRVQVLSSSISPFGMRVLVALKEKGVQYEYQEEDLHNKSQLLLASNPIHKKIPVLIHNEKIVCESMIAVQYIDEVWSSKGTPFLPDDPFQRAVARFWVDFIDKKFIEASMAVAGSSEGKPREKAANDLKDVYITLDSAVRDVAAGKPYFGGDSIGLVDIALAPFICWFRTLEELGNFKLPDDKECPHISTWIVKMMECGSVKEALAMVSYEAAQAYAKSSRAMHSELREKGKGVVP